MSLALFCCSVYCYLHSNLFSHYFYLLSFLYLSSAMFIGLSFRPFSYFCLSRIYSLSSVSFSRFSHSLSRDCYTSYFLLLLFLYTVFLHHSLHFLYLLASLCFLSLSKEFLIVCFLFSFLFHPFLQSVTVVS